MQERLELSSILAAGGILPAAVGARFSAESEALLVTAGGAGVRAFP